MIQGHSDFLGLEIYTAGIKAFKNHINAALILCWLVLSNNCSMNDAIIESSSVFNFKVDVALVFDTVLNTLQVVFGLVDNSFAKSVE